MEIPFSHSQGGISSMSLSKSEIFDEEIVPEGFPMEIPGPQFFGIEDNTNVRCHHGELRERKVAFDMAATGRRFLGCPRKDSIIRRTESGIQHLCGRGINHICPGFFSAFM